METKEVVAHGHPDLAGIALDADGGKDAFEDRSAALLFLALDFAPDGLGCRCGFEGSVLHILGCVAEAAVLPVGGLRGVGKSVEKMPLPVSGALTDRQEAA